MELVDIVDENNNLTGEVEDRWVAYEKGKWRRTVSSWIMNKKGEVLIQKRALTKRRTPGKWSKTGGQVDKGESVGEAIFREVKEELGIEIPKEQIKVVNIKKNEINRHFSYNYIFVVDYKIEEYTIQKEEVDEVKYVSIEEIEESARKKDERYNFSNWTEEDINREINLLKEKRKEILGE